MNIPLNIDWQQILLHLLNFVILAGGLYFLLYKPVKQFMAKREEHYRSVDAQAEQKLQEAEQRKADYESRLHEAQAEISETRAKAQRETDQAVRQQLDQAQAQAEQIIADARAAAGREHEKMLADAQQELKEMAVTATEKLLLQAGGDPYDQFLELAEREQSHEQK